MTRRPITKTIRFHASLVGVDVDAFAKPLAKAPAEVPEPVPTPPQPTPLQTDVTALRKLLEAMAADVSSLVETRKQALGELHGLAVDLGVMIASHVIGSKLERDELSVGPRVTQAIEQLAPKDTVLVRVHEADRDGLAELVQEHALGAMAPQIELEVDNGLPRGACVVLDGERGLVSSLEQQLESIRESLLQGLAYGRNELAGGIDVREAMRRVQERRQPA